MIGYIIIGFLAAFGALCALWVMFGAWLTAPAEGRIVIFPAPHQEEVALRRYLWLRSLSVLRGPVTVVTVAPLCPSLTDRIYWVEFLTLEQYMLRLEQEREKIDGA